MTRRLTVHPTHPQQRLLRHAAETLRRDGVVVYPTDSTYALGCAMTARDGQVRIHAIRRDQSRHELTLVCRDLSELSTLARVDNQAYRLLKALTPGPYTFILQASREIPKRLLDPRRKSIGLRIPDHPVTQALLAEFGEPMLSATLHDPAHPEPMTDVDEIEDCYGRLVDLILDGGSGGQIGTTIIDLSGAVPLLVREGCGDVERVFGPARAH